MQIAVIFDRHGNDLASEFEADIRKTRDGLQKMRSHNINPRSTNQKSPACRGALLRLKD